MKLPLLAVAAAGALGLALTAPQDAHAGKVHVDIHLGIPVAPPIRVIHAPPPRVIYAPAVVYHRHHYHRHHHQHRRQWHAHSPRPHYKHRGYAGDQWDHGYYDQRLGKYDARRGHR